MTTANLQTTLGTSADSPDSSSLPPSNDATGESPVHANTPAENRQIDALQEQLQRRAQQDPAAFRQALRAAFDGKASLEQIDQLLDLALAGKLPTSASVRIVDAGSLGQGVMGAYDSADGGTLYLDRSLLESDPELLQSVFNEEIAHHFDALLGGADAAGDEGEVFARTLDEGALRHEPLSTLRTENDHGQILVDGRLVEVEFADSTNLAETQSIITDGSSDEFITFMENMRSQGVERSAEQPFIVEVVAENWESLPEDARNFRFSDAYGNFAAGIGAHHNNLRLPDGYHLTQEVEGGKVYLHFDAHNPTDGIKETVNHGINEVVPQVLGLRDTVIKNDRPNWGGELLLGNDTISTADVAQQGAFAELLTAALARQPDADLAIGPILGGIGDFLKFVDSDELALLKERLLQGEKAIDLVHDIVALVDSDTDARIVGFVTENGAYIKNPTGSNNIEIGINTVKVPVYADVAVNGNGQLYYVNDKGKEVILNPNDRIVDFIRGPGEVRQSISSFMELAKLGVFGDNVNIFGKDYEVKEIVTTWSLANRSISAFSSFRDLNERMDLVPIGAGIGLDADTNAIKDDINGKLQDQAWAALGIGFDAWAAFTDSERNELIAQVGSKAVTLFQSIDNLRDAYKAVDSATTATELAAAQNALPGKVVSVVGAVVAIVGLVAEDDSTLKEVANYAGAILTIWGAWAKATSATGGTGAVVFAVAATIATVVSLFYEGKTNNVVLANMDVNGDGTDETVKYDPGNDRFEYMVNLGDPGITINQMDFAIEMREHEDNALFGTTYEPWPVLTFNIDPVPLIDGIPNSAYRITHGAIRITGAMQERILAEVGESGTYGPGQIPDNMKAIMHEISNSAVSAGADDPFRVMFKNEEEGGQNFLIDMNGDGNLDRVQHYMDLSDNDGPDFTGNLPVVDGRYDSDGDGVYESLVEDAEMGERRQLYSQSNRARGLPAYIVNLRDANGVEYARVEGDTLEEVTTVLATSPITLAYVASHPDLINAIGTDVTTAYSHFVGNGDERGITFDPATYVILNADVLNARGSDPAQAARHYIQYGYAEGRTTDATITSATLLNHRNMQEDPAGVLQGLAIKLPELAYMLEDADLVDVTPDEAARFIEIVLDSAPQAAAAVAEVLAADDPAAVAPPAAITPPELNLTANVAPAQPVQQESLVDAEMMRYHEMNRSSGRQYQIP